MGWLMFAILSAFAGLAGAAYSLQQYGSWAAAITSVGLGVCGVVFGVLKLIEYAERVCNKGPTKR